MDDDFFVFDIARSGEIGYKTVEEGPEVTISGNCEYAVVYNDMMLRLAADQPQKWIEDARLTGRDVE
jgi:hypothetical protein